MKIATAITTLSLVFASAAAHAAATVNANDMPEMGARCEMPATPQTVLGCRVRGIAVPKAGKYRVGGRTRRVRRLARLAIH